MLEKIDLNAVLNNVESVCKALGFKLGQSRTMMCTALKRFCASESERNSWNGIV